MPDQQENTTQQLNTENPVVPAENPTPLLDTIAPTPPPEDKKNNKALLIIGVVVLVLLALGGGGYVIYSMMSSSKTSNSQVQTEDSNAPDQDSGFVAEGEDKDGEIAPPLSDEEEEPADINGDDPAQTGVNQ